MLPTPNAYLGEQGGAQHPDFKRQGNHAVTIKDVAEKEFLPTPVASDGDKAPLAFGSGSPTLNGVMRTLLPTPRAVDGSLSGPTPAGGRHVASGAGSLPETINHGLLPTPSVRDVKDTKIGRSAHRPYDTDNLSRAFADLLPTPKASDGVFATPSSGGRAREKSTFLSTQISLLPTPTTMEHLPVRTGEAAAKARRHGRPQGTPEGVTPNLRERIVEIQQWGRYEGAVRRWESALGRPAPHRVQVSGTYVRFATRLPVFMRTDGFAAACAMRLDESPAVRCLIAVGADMSWWRDAREGDVIPSPPPTFVVNAWARYRRLVFGLQPVRPTLQLSPRFVEWMMGLDEGLVTDGSTGIGRAAQLKALGNGVVPQQAAAAISQMLNILRRVSPEAIEGLV